VLRFCSLASGSSGNATLIEATEGAPSRPTRLLVDCGLTLRQIERRLLAVGVAIADLDALLITHEHADHLGQALPLAAHAGLPVWASRGTWDAALTAADDSLAQAIAPLMRIARDQSPIAIGALQVKPFTVPHDAREPVQFIVGDGAHRLAMLTDIGSSTTYIETQISGCDALVLECNHDLDLLYNNSAYPYPLKQRISSRLGHLHNEAAAALLAAIDCSSLKHIIAAHLSEHNNHPDKARSALAQVLGCAPDWIGIANQDEGFGWRGL
jgi:phosphoribosyl 1,2-cyclic phosphodiesterase